MFWTQLGIDQGLRAYAMEHLWMNGMVGTDGELTKLGKFSADMEPTDPENAALLWYGSKFNVFERSNCYLCDPDERQFNGKSKVQRPLSSSRWRFPHHG